MRETCSRVLSAHVCLVHVFALKMLCFSSQDFGEDLLQDASAVMLFTYTDKDGFVPKPASDVTPLHSALAELINSSQKVLYG